MAMVDVGCVGGKGRDQNGAVGKIRKGNRGRCRAQTGLEWLMEWGTIFGAIQVG